MINNRVTEGVGKKIVEALKQQSDIEINTVSDSSIQKVFDQPSVSDFDEVESSGMTLSKSLEEAVASVDYESMQHEAASQTFNFSQIAHPQPQIQESFNTSSMFTAQANVSTPDFSAVEEMELPSNVAVLKQLITKLPSGVSKQTGALIIKQTMEALGISMNSVLQEAQQVQESINQSARECQNSILEYKKQINLLEAQTQKYQRQYSAINDIISLFIQTN